MKRTTLFIDEALEGDLRALARRQGRPVASVVREAVAQYVVAQTRGHRRRLTFVGLGRSGAPDTAERHEEMLFREDQASGAERPSPAAPARRSGGTRLRRTPKTRS